MLRFASLLIPLHHAARRSPWFARVIAWLGTWPQNTAAGWLMTIVAPGSDRYCGRACASGLP